MGGRSISQVEPRLTPETQESLRKTFELIEKEESTNRMVQKRMLARLHHWQGFLQDIMFESNQEGFGLGENKFVEENHAFYTQKVNIDALATPTEVMVVALHQALLNFASAKVLHCQIFLKMF